MRRVVGAGILIMMLGGTHVVHWFGEVGSELPGRPAALPATADSRVAGKFLPDRAPRATTPATSSFPEAYQADPLHFLSNAPPDSLALLPGIGPVLAARIVSDRAARGPFTEWTELDRVRGIGPVTIRRLQAAARRL
jgi:competence protein ComEA